jgi:tetratricopeptide (TPR) repeat protein
MNTPFHIHRRSHLDTVRGLLLLSDNVADLLALYARLGCDPLPPTFAVAGGFLLKLQAPPRHALPSTIRLRQMSPDLYLPADAELLPALLPDEAMALVRDRGLVFLAGGRVLEYRVDKPLALADLLTAGTIRRENWRALPERPRHAERLQSITYDRPEETAEDLLEPSGEDIGVEDPRPEDSSLPAKVKAHTSLGVGKALVRLGQMLGLKGLASLGGKLVQSALEQAPRLSESVLGAQEAALRALLREFREGNLEKALRRALPIGGPDERGGKPATNAALPTHNLLYSLRNILGGDRSGGMSIWFGGGDVQMQLTAEYRKAAQEATARGDYRRAAFIYGKLLFDYRAAAAVLSRGGLHHDAAVLYLDKLCDGLAAARSFEAAGEFDRALHLYRERSQHLPAAELLRKMGEEEDAVEAFGKAADELIRKKHDYLAAGDLMLQKAGRLDLALGYLRQGWAARPGGQANDCVIRLATQYAHQESAAELLALLDEADKFYQPPGNQTGAASFYNTIAWLADKPSMAHLRDDLRDGALVGLANKLRQRGNAEEKPGPQPSDFFGQGRHWSPATVNDATFAYKATFKSPKPNEPQKKRPAPSRTPLGDGTITVLCAAPESGQVFIGFDNGQVICFDPVQKATKMLPVSLGHPLDIACNPPGAFVVLLRDVGGSFKQCLSYRRDNDGFYHEVGHQQAKEDRLTPVVDAGFPYVGLYSLNQFTVVRDDQLTPIAMLASVLGFRLEHTCEALIITRQPVAGIEALCFGHGVMYSCNTHTRDQSETPLGWTIRPLSAALFQQHTLTWFEGDGAHCEIVRISDEGGGIYWSHLHRHESRWRLNRSGVVSGHSGYNAAAILHPGYIAAAREGRIVFLRSRGHWLVPWSTLDFPLATPLGCFYSPRTNEVTVITNDNAAVCVPVPNG